MDLSSIAYDAKRAVLNYSGIGNYSRLVIELISRRLPDTLLELYTPKVRPNPQLEPLLKQDNVRLVTPDTLAGRLAGTYWRGRGIVSQLRRDRPGLYHGLSNVLPRGLRQAGIPSVVTIHDLIFIPHPEFYHRADVAIYKKTFRHAADEADRVIAISECTRRDLVRYFGVPEEKIDVVYQGCDSSFYRPVTGDRMAEVRRKYGLPETYIVGIGTVEARKNQLLAVRALPQLPAETGLVLVGRPTGYADEIRSEAARLGVADRVRLIHGADFRDFPALYAGAAVSSYPSFYEGFGIPVIESLAAGTPVVAASGSCLEEAGGEGALYVDPRSPEEFAAAVLSIMEDNEKRRRLAEAGRRHIELFSPANFTAGLIDTYSKVAGIRI